MKKITHADKYLKDGVDVEEFISDIEYNIGIAATISDITKPTGIFLYTDDLKKFLNEQIKPPLVNDEKVILRNIDERFKYISRDVVSIDLYISSEENCTGCYTACVEFDHLFDFIRPRRRI